MLSSVKHEKGFKTSDPVFGVSYQVKMAEGLNLETRYYKSRVMRKPAFCLCENKDADQLRVDREADQRLCFRYTDSTISLLLISGISSL